MPCFEDVIAFLHLYYSRHAIRQKMTTPNCINGHVWSSCWWSRRLLGENILLYQLCWSENTVAINNHSYFYIESVDKWEKSKKYKTFITIHLMNTKNTKMWSVIGNILQVIKYMQSKVIVLPFKLEYLSSHSSIHIWRKGGDEWDNYYRFKVFAWINCSS